MQMPSEYLIDTSYFNEGGYCQFYPIVYEASIGFKEFSTKRRAEYARSVQEQLSQFDLAPQVYGQVYRLGFSDKELGQSGWGYVTEIADVIDSMTRISLRDMQNLVENIRRTTNLKFWDCHWSNVGLVQRKNKKKLVCIDTGKESFDGWANAWGFADPGPKCSYCNRYQCRCSEE